MTKDQNEIDLIIERPGRVDILVEIKSTQQVQKRLEGSSSILVFLIMDINISYKI